MGAMHNDPGCCRSSISDALEASCKGPSRVMREGPAWAYAQPALVARDRKGHLQAAALSQSDTLWQQQDVAMSSAVSTTVQGMQAEKVRLKRIAVFCGASFGNSPVYTECAKALGQEMIKRQIGLVDLWLCARVAQWGAKLESQVVSTLGTSPAQYPGLPAQVHQTHHAFSCCLQVYGGGSVGLMSVIATTVAGMHAAVSVQERWLQAVTKPRAEGLGQSSVFGVIPEALKPREVCAWHAACQQLRLPCLTPAFGCVQISGDTIGEILVVPGEVQKLLRKWRFMHSVLDGRNSADMHTRKAGFAACPAHAAKVPLLMRSWRSGQDG